MVSGVFLFHLKLCFPSAAWTPWGSFLDLGFFRLASQGSFFLGRSQPFLSRRLLLSEDYLWNLALAT